MNEAKSKRGGKKTELKKKEIRGDNKAKEFNGNRRVKMGQDKLLGESKGHGR